MRPITPLPSDDLLPCLVIGAGVAAHATMVWLQSYGVQATWLADSPQIGGMLFEVYNPLNNVPGHDYPEGAALAHALNAQRAQSKLSPPRQARITYISLKEDTFLVTARDSEGAHQLRARTVMLATGTRPTPLELDTSPTPHVTTTDSAFFSRSASRDGVRFAQKRVAVLGGGDAAFENALILANTHQCEVHLLMRSTPKARRKFVSRVMQAREKIHVWPIPTSLSHVQEHEDHVTLHLESRGASHTLDVACLFVRIGVSPMLPELDLQLDTDPGGFLITDAAQRTSHPRLFAAGDVTAEPMQSVVTAASSGAIAALHIARELGAYDYSDEELDALTTPPPAEPS